ncbi:hypothetical protein [Calothrix sp. NIES-3974]|uniref:hypothetical protein n=1 Tax=Calothrix sp. NIES-3974 TaxID=2005462 RepID=UPI00156173FC|nr:hypothetical protein [Calothrix sp. NIES-3974]
MYQNMGEMVQVSRRSKIKVCPKQVKRSQRRQFNLNSTGFKRNNLCESRISEVKVQSNL